MQLYAYWSGQDAESGIGTYEVGLSTAKDTLVPDLVPFTPSHAGKPFVSLHHPNIKEGSKFYFVLRATNKAQLQKTKVRVF